MHSCLLLLVFLSLSVSSSAVKCYKCEVEDATDDNAQCTEECEGGLCVKREAEMQDGKVRISKSCVAAGIEGCGAAKLWGQSGTQCLCSQDYCNSGSFVSASMSLFMLVIVVVFLQ